jgi:O-antigen/teichoic acid export membrane protein
MSPNDLAVATDKVQTSRRRLAIDAAFSTLSLAVAQVLSGLLYILVARHSSPSAYAAAMGAVGIALVLSCIFDFGTNSLIVRQGASGIMPPTDFARRYVAKSSVLVTLAAGCVIASRGLGISNGQSKFTLIGSLSAAVALSQMTVAPLRARSWMGRVAVVTVADKAVASTIALALLFFKALQSGHLWLCILSGSTTSLVIALAMWPHEYKTALRIALARPRSSLLNPWQHSFHLGLSSVVISLQSLDTALVALSAGPHAAGTFAAVNRWVYPLSLIASGYTQATYPHIARARDHRSAMRILLHGWWLIPIACAGVVFVVVAAPILIKVILGSGYAGSVAVLRILMIGLVPCLLNQPLYTFLAARHRERWSSSAFLTAIPLQLTLLWVGARTWGAAGAALGFAIAQILLLVVLITMVWRSSRPRG